MLFRSWKMEEGVKPGRWKWKKSLEDGSGRKAWKMEVEEKLGRWKWKKSLEDGSGRKAWKMEVSEWRVKADQPCYGDERAHRNFVA